MTYPDPLRLIPEHYIEELSENTIKQVRKELLLRFDLHQSTTIDINSQSYDKNTIIQTFDELKKNLDFHFRLYHNKALYQFITKGDTDFFTKSGAWYDLENLDFQAWLKPYFVDRFGDAIYQILKNKQGFHKGNHLHKILKSGFKLPLSYEATAYVSSYEYLKNYFREASLQYKEPFTDRSYSRLKAGIDRYIDSSYVKVFNILPPSFNPIAIEYKHFLRNIVSNAFFKMRYLDNFDLSSLKEILRAAQICTAIEHDPSLTITINELSAYLNNPTTYQKRYSEEYLAVNIFKIILYSFVSIGLISVFIAINIPNTKSRSNHHDQISQKLERKGKAKEAIFGKWVGIESFKGKDYVVELRFLNAHKGKRILYLNDKDNCKIEQNFSWKLKGGKYLYEENCSISLSLGNIAIKKLDEGICQNNGIVSKHQAKINYYRIDARWDIRTGIITLNKYNRQAEFRDYRDENGDLDYNKIQLLKKIEDELEHKIQSPSNWLGNGRINIYPDNYQLTLSHWTGEIELGKILLQDDQYWVTTNFWEKSSSYNNKNICISAGFWKDLKYIDKKGIEKTANVEFCYKIGKSQNYWLRHNEIIN